MAAAKVCAGTVDNQVQSADFVFEGVVADVQTRFSERADDASPLVPYRFITYRIVRVLKGNYQNPMVTLRFLGGATAEGQVLLMAGQPLFDVGDHDLLLVKGNNRYPCPLVGCAQGRYRYLGGMVVNELGQRIYFDGYGQIVLGEKIDNDELTTNQLSDDVVITTREVLEYDSGEPVADVPDYADATSADPAGFTSNMDEKIHQLHSYEQLANLPPFQSSDPDATFVDPTLSPVGGAVSSPPPVDGAANGVQMPEDERLERAQETARMATMLAANMGIERQRELAERNRAMAQQHPDFHAGEADAAAVVPAPGTTAGAATGLLSRHTSHGFAWFAAGVAVLVLGGGLILVRAYRR